MLKFCSNYERPVDRHGNMMSGPGLPEVDLFRIQATTSSVLSVTWTASSGSAGECLLLRYLAICENVVGETVLDGAEGITTVRAKFRLQ